jgi:ribosome-associated protein
MGESDRIRVSATLNVPRDELVFRASRSGGPGGQHVNTSSTRIELVWDVGASPSLDSHQRVYLMQRLASRLDSQGKLRLVAQNERSQFRNREAAIARFVAVVARALAVPKHRKPTRPPGSSKRARLESKKKRGALKRDRRRPSEE